MLCCVILIAIIGLFAFFTGLFLTRHVNIIFLVSVIHRLLKQQHSEMKKANAMLLHRMNNDYEDEKEDNSLISRNATHTNLSIFDSNI